MLDTDTKRRIDTARDILVGKVPDPKSQVEQITIALIYKFMDDMDAESEEMGGKRKFFAGEFARYGWAKLMRSGLGGHETLNLYGEAIAKMPENPGVPKLFRDIFKNAYLPYRDPETLKGFLKIIDEFNYDHSERLGDAFEYLLSVLGSQGDAGQFRTPRHIIDFMVEVLAPKKNETVLDPACGTAGFLISAYKHILRANTDATGNSKLTPDEKGLLAKNFIGYDISPDMVRLSLANLYLHGFADPHIYEYDTLTSEERWNEFADVILANPPFMSPKGGIKPHKRFSIQAKRSEVLFVDYMAEHLTPKGRAAIIVPEGIIFQSQTAYTQLRKMLVENFLVAVVSLPSGIFQPYSGVKTSILILDKSIARQSDTIAFFKVENDGFGLGAQRRAIEKNDLPQVKIELAVYLQAIRTGADIDTLAITTGLIVPKQRFSENADYNLSGERYRDVISPHRQLGRLVPLRDVCTFQRGFSYSTAQIGDEKTGVPFYNLKSIKRQRGVQSNDFKYSIGDIKDRHYVQAGDILIALTDLTPTSELIGSPKLITDKTKAAYSADLGKLIFQNDRTLPRYLYCLLQSSHYRNYIVTYSCGANVKHLQSDGFYNFQIPLPPLEIQKEIVAEIEGYQKVIDGARAVVDNYRPHIPINPSWPMVEIEAISTVVRGSSPRPQGDPRYFGGPVPRLMVADITRDGMYTIPQIDSLTKLGATKSRPMKKNDVIVTVSGNPGLPTILANDACIHDGFVGLRNLKDDVLPAYLYFALLALHLQHGALSVGAVFKNLTTDQVRGFKIALPPLEIQQAIVAEIEAEQALVNANRELIVRMEKKIQGVLSRVWGEEAVPQTEPQ